MLLPLSPSSNRPHRLLLPVVHSQRRTGVLLLDPDRWVRAGVAVLLAEVAPSGVNEAEAGRSLAIAACLQVVAVEAAVVT